MKRNRKHKHRLTTSMIAPALLLLFLFGAAVTYRILDIRIEDRSQEIKVLETKLAARNEQHLREEAAWNAMRTPERLHAAIRNHGLSLSTPNASQIVHVRRDGTMRPSQAILARATQSVNSRQASSARR